jgi:CspA family cold shock protein
MANTGTIARLVGDRGFGFVRDEQGKEYFFHHTAVQGGTFDSLREGQAVAFDQEADRGKGDRAVNVRPA